MDSLFWVQLIQDILLVIFNAVAPLVAIYVVALLRKWGIRQWLILNQDIAKQAVAYAQQFWKTQKGYERFETAMERFIIIARNRGIKLGTRQELEVFIQAAYQEFKDAFGEEWGKETTKGLPEQAQPTVLVD